MTVASENPVGGPDAAGGSTRGAFVAEPSPASAIVAPFPALTRSVDVLIMPEDGVAPVSALVRMAKQRLLVKVATLSDAGLIADIVAAHRRGIDVRVMLNQARAADDRPNDAIFAQLRAAAVAVRPTSPAFAVTHEKSIVVDDDLVLIATFNFGTRYFTRTRDVGAVVSEREVIDEIGRCFFADWLGRSFVPRPAGPLIWGNTNARAGMRAFIDSARCSLDVQHPKYLDPEIQAALCAALGRGVALRVLWGGKISSSEAEVPRTLESLGELRHHGAALRRQVGLRLHTKLLLADSKRALIGSMNIDPRCFDVRREVGLHIAEVAAVARLRRFFDVDWECAVPFDLVEDPNS